MLQPALNQPALIQPDLIQPDQIEPALIQTAPPATYGTLMTATREAVEDALALGAQRLPDAETGARELAGYARFLRYAGNHLHTLMRLAEVRNDGIRRLVQRLNTIDETDPTTGPTTSRWLHAATLLGTAHDLLATHLTGVGIPRTPEGDEVLTGPETVTACVELAHLVLTAVDGSSELIHRTARTQQRRGLKVVPTQTFNRLHDSNRAASLYARAALWDLKDHHTGVPTTRLGHLCAAIGFDHPGTARPPEFATSLAALRLLRHYSYAQARGLTPASPASLRDLALLGARLTDPDSTLGALPDPTTPLERLHRAHLTDQLTEAHQAWTGASTELGRTVQGLTKAPVEYAVTIHALLDADLTPGLRRAIGTALPPMGTEAAAAIEHLAQRAELVTLQRPPLKTRHEWRPILPDHTTTIAGQFTTAAHASRRAITTLATDGTPPRQPEARRQDSVRLEQQRQVTR